MSAGEAAALLRPAGDDLLEFYEIGSEIGRTGSDGPQLQQPIARTLFTPV